MSYYTFLSIFLFISLLLFALRLHSPCVRVSPTVQLVKFPLCQQFRLRSHFKTAPSWCILGDFTSLLVSYNLQFRYNDHAATSFSVPL